MSNLTKNDLTRKEFELNLAGLVGDTVDEVDTCKHKNIFSNCQNLKMSVV